VAQATAESGSSGEELPREPDRKIAGKEIAGKRRMEVPPREQEQGTGGEAWSEEERDRRRRLSPRPSSSFAGSVSTLDIMAARGR
jgi:hypothetical protein